MNSHLDHTASARSLTSRFYEPEHDLLHMQGLLMEARSRTDDWHYSHVGELAWGFFMVACHLNPPEHIRLWHDAEGKLVAYAVLGEDPSFDFQVLPEYEWSGIETEAMAWAETRLTELRKSSGQAKRADSMDAFDLALAKAERVGGVTVLSGTFPVGPQDLAAMTREWANRSPSPFVLILNGRGKTAASAISVSGVAMSAKAILEAGIGILGGKGGGRDDFAQGAGPLVDKLPEAMEAYKGAVRRNLPSAESDATGRTG